MCSVFIVAFLLVGANVFGNCADQSSSLSSGTSYLVSSPNAGPQKFSEWSPNGELINYEYIPMSTKSREKRDTEEAVTVEPKTDVKGSPSAKKPTDAVKNVNHTSESVLTTASTPTPSTAGSAVAGNFSAPNVTNTTVPASTPTPAKPADTLDDQLDREFPNYPLFSMNATDKMQIQNDTHTYYNTSIVEDGLKYWEDLDEHPLAEDHQMLSNAHRRAATMKLHFDFPFYGHMVDNATIATGGFVYLGEQAHKWLAATQYAAPLMANFDSSLSENATIRFLSTDSQFTVEWRNVHLKDSPETGAFTFQLSMYKNGTIAFIYNDLPVPIAAISDQFHPVKVGISDAYIRDKNILFVKQKTIYEYHRVELKNRGIKNGTAIIFTPLPMCLNFKTCSDCVHHNSTFECTWCPSANRCSDGTDRYRHDWIDKNCDRNHTSNTDYCTTASQSPYNVETSTTLRSTTLPSKNRRIDEVDKSHMTQEEENGMSAGGVISILLLVMLVVGTVGWVFYAYLFPHSTSGQLLIRYRPSQWTLRRGEARYTAASIHM